MTASYLLKLEGSRHEKPGSAKPSLYSLFTTRSFPPTSFNPKTKASSPSKNLQPQNPQTQEKERKKLKRGQAQGTSWKCGTQSQTSGSAERRAAPEEAPRRGLRKAPPPLGATKRRPPSASAATSAAFRRMAQNESGRGFEVFFWEGSKM